MRRILETLAVIVFSTALALAQGRSGGRGPQDRDDHDDHAPIQSGYAVITPATTSGTGLVVFETFGLRGNEGNAGALQAGVLPADLTTNAILFVDSSGRLSKNLGVAIVNPNSANVNVSMTLRADDGTRLATKTVNVLSHEQKSQFVTELFKDEPSVPSDFTGTLAITSAGSSNLAVSVTGLRFRGKNFSTLPVTSVSGTTAVPTIASGVGGAGAVLLPQFVTGGGWATELVMANTGTSSLTVRVDLFKQDGSPLTAALNGQSASSFKNLVIPAGGVLTLAPRDRNGDDDF